jgi:phenylalanyl-tRNA synthetase alpha chain
MQDLEKILQDFNVEISNAKNKQEVEDLRIKFLGKKGLITELFVNLKNITSIEEKKAAGASLNGIKEEVTQKIDATKEQFEILELSQKLQEEKIDVTIAPRKKNQGFVHPISKTIKEVSDIFSKLGFKMAEGPEIENDFHNFSALNIPANHPARQMQDTFYLNKEEGKEQLLLRTHTSTVQIRQMLNEKPPLKVCAIGRVFRKDSDQTHTPMFHQIEGFVVDKNVNMANLKWVLERFLKEFFEVDNLSLRFRPSFFPFTEPSAEVDIGYSIQNGRIKIGSDEKFMEILGCGMINRNVLINCKIDPDEYQGFAFGIGIERLAMLKYGITDLRMFFENDIRFLKHYGFSLSEF